MGPQERAIWDEGADRSEPNEPSGGLMVIGVNCEHRSAQDKDKWATYSQRQDGWCSG